MLQIKKFENHQKKFYESKFLQDSVMEIGQLKILRVMIRNTCLTIVTQPQSDLNKEDEEDIR